MKIFKIRIIMKKRFPIRKRFLFSSFLFLKIKNPILVLLNFNDYNIKHKKLKKKK